MRSSYDAKYDILKFILSLFVVAIHAYLSPRYLYPWLRMAVPLFFMMTSYFVFSKLRAGESRANRAVIRKFAGRNFKLYAFWFVVLLPLTIYTRRTRYITSDITIGLNTFVHDLLFGGTFVASWYITASVTGVAIIFALTRKIKSAFVFAISLLSFCFVTLCSSYTSVPLVKTLLQDFALWFKNTFANPIFSFPASLIWIFMGKCFAEGKIKLSRKTAGIVFLFSCIGLFLEWKLVQRLENSVSNDSFFMLLPVCVSFFALFQSIGPLEFKYSYHLKQASTVIYCTHGTLISIVRFGLRILLGIRSTPVIFVMTLLVCLAIYASIACIVHRHNNKLTRILRYAY